MACLQCLLQSRGHIPGYFWQIDGGGALVDEWLTVFLPADGRIMDICRYDYQGYV